MSRDLSHDTRELLVLARGDAPTPKSRDQIWDSLERALLPAAAGAAGAAAAATKVATSPTAWQPLGAAAKSAGAAIAPAAHSAGLVSALASAKIIIAGALVGGAVIVSSALVAVHHRDAKVLAAWNAAETRPAVVYSDEGAVGFSPPSAPATFTGAATRSQPSLATAKEERTLTTAAHTSLSTPAPRVSLTSETSSDDTLLREASLVGEARSALLRGDPQTALVSVQAARREGRNLEPEELSIEARALRALGREPEAAQLETTLRARYPNHALARER
ncbi:MAG TPA: hypothetical protein VNO21_07210 [Polyangiaceae bacterium]|nr:hypothetical protein [Polyangiaceae bacterium]